MEAAARERGDGGGGDDRVGVRFSCGHAGRCVRFRRRAGERGDRASGSGCSGRR